MSWNDEGSRCNESIILYNEQVEMLREWIKPNKLAKVELSLIYRSSRDGFSASDFHRKCDNAGPTVTIIKSQFGKICGGYTSRSWTTPAACGTFEDSKAFTFSITRKMKCLVREDKRRVAVCHWTTFGPEFTNEIEVRGTFKDIYAKAGVFYEVPNEIIDYDSFYGDANYFSAKEAEVFRVDII